MAMLSRDLVPFESVPGWADFCLSSVYCVHGAAPFLQRSAGKTRRNAQEGRGNVQFPGTFQGAFWQPWRRFGQAAERCVCRSGAVRRPAWLGGARICPAVQSREAVRSGRPDREIGRACDHKVVLWAQVGLQLRRSASLRRVLGRSDDGTAASP